MKDSVLLKRLMEHIPLSVFFKDAESRFISVNEICASKFGLNSASEAIGKTDFDFFDHEHADQAYADEQQIMKTLEPIIDKEEREVFVDGETRIRWSTTSKFPLMDDEGKLLGTFGVSKDITDIKKQYLEQERLKNQMETILNSVPNLIFVKDHTGRYQIANDATNAFLDPVEKNIVGKRDVDIGVSKKEANKYIQMDHEVISSGKSQFYPEIKTHTPDGKEVWFQFIKTPFEYADGKLGALSVVTDVSERIQHEIELMESLHVIEKQNQRLSNFAHIVSHNLRNHAGGISTTLDLLEIVEEDEKPEIIDILRKASDRLNETIADLNEIIDNQNKDATELKYLNFQEYLDNIKEVLATEMKDKKVVLHEDIEDDLEILYNPAYLESILINLISNAIKYRHPDRTPELSISAKKEKGNVVLTVADNGLGIDLASYGDKVFDMYKTFHNNENAKGIGLYITRNQIEALGGSIKVESKEGEGTTFIVDFGKQIRDPQSELA